MRHNFRDGPFPGRWALPCYCRVDILQESFNLGRSSSQQFQRIAAVDIAEHPLSILLGCLLHDSWSTLLWEADLYFRLGKLPGSDPPARCPRDRFTQGD